MIKDNYNVDLLIDKTGLTIEEMSALVGVHRDTLYKWRTGKRNQIPSIVRLFEIIEWAYDNNMLDELRNRLWM